MDLFSKPTKKVVVKKSVKPLGKLTKTKLKSYLVKGMKGSGVDPKIMKHLNGMGFWNDLWSGIKSVGEKALPVITPILTGIIKKKIGLGVKSKVGRPKKVIHKVGGARRLGAVYEIEKVGGAVAKKSKTLKASDGRAKRAEIVKKIMRENGLSMIDASKMVKSQGLY